MVYKSHAMMFNHLKFTVTIVLSAFLLNHAAGQSDPGFLLKAGALPYFNRYGYSAFSAHIEFEGAFKRTPFLTSGPRIDYINSKNNSYSMMIGYDLKLYPRYRKSRGPYQGLFIGVEAGYFPRASVDTHTEHGPGFGPLLGYQHIVKNKISVAFEAGMPFLSDSKTYFYGFANIKVGLLRVWSNE